MKYCVPAVGKLINPENWCQRNNVVAVIVPDCVVYMLVEWFTGGVWKCLERQPREALECFKQSLMVYSGQSSENLDAERNVDGKSQAQEVSVGNKYSIGNWREACLLHCDRKYVCILPMRLKLCWGLKLRVVD